MTSHALALTAAIRALADEPHHVRALAELLDREITERDMKPENILEDDAKKRQPSMTDDAIRARRRRAEAAKQLELVTVVDRSRPVATDHTPLSQDPDPPPPTLKKIRKGSPAPAVAYDPDRPPVWLLAMAPGVRTDLAEYDLRDMWRSFCAVIVARGFGHKSDADLQSHLRNWLRIEDRQKRAASREAYGAAYTAPEHAPAPETPPISAVEPLEHPDDIVATPTHAELAKARFRGAPPAMQAGFLRELPPDANFDLLFPPPKPEPRSMSA